MSSDAKKNRRSRIGIVTTKMPEEVYDQLIEKASKSQLTKYIIELVQRDLANQHISLDFESLSNEIQSMKKEYKKIEKVFIYNGDVAQHEIGKMEIAKDTEINEEGISDIFDLDF